MSSHAAGLASTPEPPYYAVVFTSVRTPDDDDGYAAMANAMSELATKQKGYLGIETTRGADRLGITVSYWASLDAIREWKANVDHLVAQRRGREEWYAGFEMRICKVERAYSFRR